MLSLASLSTGELLPLKQMPSESCQKDVKNLKLEVCHLAALQHTARTARLKQLETEANNQLTAFH